MNVGATKPEDYGDYFAWGETQPKSEYYWSTYKWYSGIWLKLTKYCYDTDFYNYGYNGFVDNKTELDLEDDAAYVNWGPMWRMPSKEQIIELINKCTTEWTTKNGVNGRLFTSKINGASLFLPATGRIFGSELDCTGESGQYWARTLSGYSPDTANNLCFGSDELYAGDSLDRYGGRSIRAVREPQN